mgnify:FL=1
MKNINKYILVFLFILSMLSSCKYSDTLDEITVGKPKETVETPAADSHEDDEEPTIPPVGGG